MTAGARVQVGGTCKHWVAYSLETSEGFTRQSFNALVSPRRARPRRPRPFPGPPPLTGAR